jgi:hypothetical protein
MVARITERKPLAASVRPPDNRPTRLHACNGEQPDAMADWSLSGVRDCAVADRLVHYRLYCSIENTDVASVALFIVAWPVYLYTDVINGTMTTKDWLHLQACQGVAAVRVPFLR